jgi:hypothetical protein
MVPSPPAAGDGVMDDEDIEGGAIGHDASTWKIYDDFITEKHKYC